MHRHKGHDLQHCQQVEQLAEKQRAEYQRRDKEKARDDGEGSVKKKGGQGYHPGKPKNKRVKPVQARERKEEDEDEDCPEDDSSDHEFQRATDMICLDGGASLHYSHRQLNKWEREVSAAQPSIGTHKPLKWSHTQIIFDSEDHPHRVTAVGCLLLLVSPTICNLKVTKMLVDDGSGLNLISPT